MSLIRFVPLGITTVGALAGMAIGLSTAPDFVGAVHANQILPGEAGFTPAPSLSAGTGSSDSAQVVDCTKLVRTPAELTAVCSDGSVKLTKAVWYSWQSAAANGSAIVVRTSGAHKGSHAAIVDLSGYANYGGNLIFTTLKINYNDGSAIETFPLAQAPTG